jgi:acetate kinase
MTRHILTLNAGSSSLKFALYAATEGHDPVVSGEVDGIGPEAGLVARLPGGEVREQRLETCTGHSDALDAALTLIGDAQPGSRVVAVSHRIVHGGPDRSGSVQLDSAALADLEGLCGFAPLHQPHNLAGVRAATAAFPDAMQIGSFDTAFHRGHPWVNDTFALPRAYFAQGVRRYGFHGLSYDYIAGRLAIDWPALHRGRVIVAHLGNGASMCALKEGRSVASTMGFTALDGLPMGTRSGQIDPGVVLWLIGEKGMMVGEVTDLLYRQSGLLGLSDVSHDMRQLEASPDPAAADAISYFVSRIRREIGSLAAALGGLDAVVFTGGIGANSGLVRRLVCEDMEWIGMRFDAEANAAGEMDIAGPGSRVGLLVLPTDEESILVREARRHLAC